MSLEVYYCKLCSIPPEFCQYTPSGEKCKKVLEKDNPDLYKKLFEPKPKTIVEALTAEVAEKLNLAGDESAGLNAASGAAAAADEADESIGEDGEKKHQSRGGKGLVRDESAKLDKEAQKRAKAKIVLKLTTRNRRKAVTHVRGFELFGLDLKKVAKRFAGKYACGSSVVKDNGGYEEIDIQGDFVDDLIDFIPKEFPEIKKSQIVVEESKKESK